MPAPSGSRRTAPAYSSATSSSRSSPSPDPAITFHRVDVADEGSWAELVAATVAKHGRVDILVNNAGVIRYAAVDSCTLDEWHESVAVNQTGVFLGMRAVIPEMRKVGGGAIVNVSSIWGQVAVAGAIGYHATKGSVTLMTKSAALSLIPDNIRVNSVHPGFIDTPLTQAQDPGHQPLGHRPDADGSRRPAPGDREWRAVPCQRRGQLRDWLGPLHRRRLHRAVRAGEAPARSRAMTGDGDTPMLSPQFHGGGSE